ncbi:hypothetical protein PG988_011218 [Apiospora saccharicola]
MYRPEQMRALCVPKEQEREKYERWLRGLDDQMEKNGPEPLTAEFRKTFRYVAEKVSKYRQGSKAKRAWEVLGLLAWTGRAAPREYAAHFLFRSILDGAWKGGLESAENMGDSWYQWETSAPLALRRFQWRTSRRWYVNIEDTVSATGPRNTVHKG